jgi:hypothetical protein
MQGRLQQARQVRYYMLKTGQKEPDDLSDNEAVQMGLVMQEPIMRPPQGVGT